MCSSYLNQERRPLPKVMGDILANALDHYVLAYFDHGEPWFREIDAGIKFDRLVAELAEGQYTYRDGDSPVAVVRFSIRDNEAELVTDKVAQAVGDLIAKEDGSRVDEWRQCSFLDVVWPDWKLEQRRVA